MFPLTVTLEPVPTERVETERGVGLLRWGGSGWPGHLCTVSGPTLGLGKCSQSQESGVSSQRVGGRAGSGQGQGALQ